MSNVSRPSRRAVSVTMIVAALAAFGGGVAACGSDDPSTSTWSPVDVFAAASLTAAFSEIGDAYTAANPGSPVAFNFAGSSELVAQIGEGAPADVFAAADRTNMTRLTDAGDVAGDPVVFATNVAEIIVESGNPLGIMGVADLARDDLVVVLCSAEVPCGAYAAQILDNADVAVAPKSLEENVKAVVTKVTLGEADAGIVYRTDVTAVGDDAEGVAISAELNVVAEYPIAVTASNTNAEGARSFIDFVLSPTGQEILASYGFGPP